MNFLRSWLQRDPLKPAFCCPTLFLDLDGVIAPLHSLPEHTPHQVITSNPYITWVVPDATGAWLQELVDAGTNIIWVSSWEQDANLLNDALELPRFPHLALPAVSAEWPKLHPVRTYVHKRAGNAPTVWVDDELTADAKGWASTIPNLITISPDARTGLTAADLRSISQHLLPETLRSAARASCATNDVNPLTLRSKPG